MDRRLFFIVSQLASFGKLAVLMQIIKLPTLWVIRKATPSEVDVAIVFLIAGVILLIPYGLIKLLNRPQHLLRSTGYTKIDTASAKHRRYDFYKFHRQVLLDNGFEELFDARFDSTTCTFFASSNRDMIAEVGIFNYGRSYYGVRTVTEDGTLYESRSGGFKKGTPSDPESIQLCIFEKMPLENLLREHAKRLANCLQASKSRLVILKDQVIDHLFLANRYRYTG